MTFQNPLQTIHLTILSQMADPSLNPTWHGKFQTRERSPATINQDIFRAFNRVTLENSQTLMGMDYLLPSLSVGDIVSWATFSNGHLHTYVVTPCGFQVITGREIHGRASAPSAVPGMDAADAAELSQVAS